MSQENNNGVKISDMEELRNLSGNEMIPLAIDDKNYHIKTGNLLPSVEYTEEDLREALKDFLDFDK